MDQLIELDSVMGDGDLGLTMSRSFAAAVSSIGGKPHLGVMIVRAACDVVRGGYDGSTK